MNKVTSVIAVVLVTTLVPVATIWAFLQFMPISFVSYVESRMLSEVLGIPFWQITLVLVWGTLLFGGLSALQERR